MVSSMTAFASKRINTDYGEVYWEIRGVNHRFLDLTFKLPESLKGLESECRALLRKNLSRGKVECTLKYKPLTTDDLNINHDLVRSIISTISKLQKNSNNISAVDPISLMSWPGVIEEIIIDQHQFTPVLLQHLSTVVNDFIAMRDAEGAALNKVFKEKIAVINQSVAVAKSRYPLVIEAYRSKLHKRLDDIKKEADVDEHRLAQEMIYIAQKYDVEEEFDRLLTHVAAVEKSLNLDEPVGRKLDFLMQELHREANTLASKSLDAQITQAAVNLKVAIEQIREQVQNIE